MLLVPKPSPALAGPRSLSPSLKFHASGSQPLVQRTCNDKPIILADADQFPQSTPPSSPALSLCSVFRESSSVAISRVGSSRVMSPQPRVQWTSQQEQIQIVRSPPSSDSIRPLVFARLSLLARASPTMLTPRSSSVARIHCDYPRQDFESSLDPLSFLM